MNQKGCPGSNQSSSRTGHILKWEVQLPFKNNQYLNLCLNISEKERTRESWDIVRHTNTAQDSAVSVILDRAGVSQGDGEKARISARDVRQSICTSGSP